MSTEINTFSAAVDDVILRSGRPDRQADIISFIRVTIRELQVRRFFRNDLTEDTLTATSNNYVWEYPQNLRILRTVRYPYFDARNNRIYPSEVLPGEKQKEYLYFYYGGPGYYVFGGTALGDSIDVAYYSYLPKLAYYEEADRPARFYLETDAWEYLSPGTATENEAARNKVTNWLLMNYYDFVVEGAMAKILKVVGDDRAPSSFALYKSYQKDLEAGEPSDSLNK